MKTAALFVLLVASPAFAQSKVYTNADLGKPIAAAPLLTPAEAAALLAPYQFRSVVPDRPIDADGPRIYIIDSSPTAGPYGEIPPPLPDRRLNGTLLSQPNWDNYLWLGSPYGYGGGGYGYAPGRARRGSPAPFSAAPAAPTPGPVVVFPPPSAGAPPRPAPRR